MSVVSPLTLADADGMLAAIAEKYPRPEYSMWIEVTSAMLKEFGEAAIPVLDAYWPGETPGEYAQKARCPLKDFTIGTMVYYAQQVGWRGTTGASGHKPRPQAPKKIVLSPRTPAEKFGYIEFTNSKYIRGNIDLVFNRPVDMWGYSQTAYRSYFMFTEDILLYQAANRSPENKSGIRFYPGPVWCDRIQIDHDSKTDLSVALHSARLWADAFPDWKVYYTGSKGFRNVSPDGYLSQYSGYPQTPKILKNFVEIVHKKIGGEMPDTSFYHATGLIRVPNSRHEKTGLYQIELTTDELKTLTVDQIRDLARNQRAL